MGDVHEHEEAPEAAEVGQGEENSDVEVGRGEAEAAHVHEPRQLDLGKKNIFHCFLQDGDNVECLIT